MYLKSTICSWIYRVDFKFNNCVSPVYHITIIVFVTIAKTVQQNSIWIRGQKKGNPWIMIKQNELKAKCVQLSLVLMKIKLFLCIKNVKKEIWNIKWCLNGVTSFNIFFVSNFDYITYILIIFLFATSFVTLFLCSRSRSCSYSWFTFLFGCFGLILYLLWV